MVTEQAIKHALQERLSITVCINKVGGALVGGLQLYLSADRTPTESQPLQFSTRSLFTHCPSPPPTPHATCYPM